MTRFGLVYWRFGLSESKPNTVNECSSLHMRIVLNCRFRAGDPSEEIAFKYPSEEIAFKYPWIEIAFKYPWIEIAPKRPSSETFRQNPFVKIFAAKPLSETFPVETGLTSADESVTKSPSIGTGGQHETQRNPTT